MHSRLCNCLIDWWSWATAALATPCTPSHGPTLSVLASAPPVLFALASVSASSTSIFTSVALLCLTEFDNNMEDALRDRYVDPEDELPAYRLFKKGSTSAIVYDEAHTMSGFKKFMKRGVRT